MLLSTTADLVRAPELAAYGYDAIDAMLCRVIYNNDPYPHNPLLDGDDYEMLLDKHIEECDRLGLKIVTSHIPYRFDYADPTIERYDYYYNMTCRALKASEYLGAKWAVVHAKSADETIPYVKKLLRDSGVTKIGIALENIYTHPIEELILAHDTLESEGYRVGICLDTGHAHVKKHYVYDVAEVVRLLGRRIKMLHVHDNVRVSDMHAVPYGGSIKWDGVLRALAEVGYDGAFNFELHPERVIKEAREDFEHYCVALGRAMSAKIEEYRDSL